MLNKSPESGKNKARIKFSPALILFPFFLFYFISCQKEATEKIEKLLSDEKFPSETGRNIVFIYSDSARVKARLLTPLMYKYTGENPTVEMPEGLRVTFFDRNLDSNTYLEADYGIQYVDERKIEVRDNVVVVNNKGDTLITEQLIWDERKNKIFSNKSVRLISEDEIILAEGLETNPDFSYYKFKNVIGEIQLKDNDQSDNEEK